MFSGIIRHTGKIKKIYKNNNNCIMEILSRIKFSKSEIGSSISCSGTCLTLEKYKGNLSKFYISKETLNRTNFKLAKKNMKYLIQKGSITIDGISLTISKILIDGFQIVIIPHTLKLTNLVYLKEKDVVNVEFDVLGKYIKRFLK